MAIRIDWIVFLIIAVALLEGATSETKYKVGDDGGWRVPDNKSYYENWVGGKKFEVGDSLEFNWTDTHNVLEVTTKTEYDACAKTNGILKDTSPATFQLTKDGTYYYICTIGMHCDFGQKVTIVVGNGSSSSPPTSMPNNHAALSAVLSTITIVAASLVHLSSFLLY
ncbi:PREDICTED: cucumber peeling cupredoxin-like [Populus euphratica]|uniref:Cucumber peeling cupredoxin-like n=1 Tax=Populus euphratica TaxID=75702 RepID=A0AAJ6TYU1_POPEU|nr:PREDICTED: cucumber peeling cupredoxin-like [Populus euphratica]